MSKKRINKCPSYDEHWGCAISPMKRCDGCPNADWQKADEEGTNKESIKKHLRKQLTDAANAYALELHRQWGMERTGDDYWIAGEEHPACAPYQLHAYYFLSLDDIQYIIDHGISQDEYDQYHTYCERLALINFSIPTLRQWRERPDRRVADDQLEHIQMLREQLGQEIERVKEKVKSEK